MALTQPTRPRAAGVRSNGAVAPASGPDPSDLQSWLVPMSECEMRRIARDLHDVIGQDLTAIQLSLLAAQRAPDLTEVQERLEVSAALADHALADIRSMALDMRSRGLDHASLPAAIRDYLDGQQELSGVQISLRASRLGHVAPDVEAAAYRIIQEAVLNAVRHASPHRIGVSLTSVDAQLEVSVDDDGIGFDVERATSQPTSLGLGNMSERAYLCGGTIEFTSEPGRGTRVIARLPEHASS